MLEAIDEIISTTSFNEYEARCQLKSIFDKFKENGFTTNEPVGREVFLSDIHGEFPILKSLVGNTQLQLADLMGGKENQTPNKLFKIKELLSSKDYIDDLLKDKSQLKSVFNQLIYTSYSISLMVQIEDGFIRKKLDKPLSNLGQETKNKVEKISNYAFDLSREFRCTRQFLELILTHINKSIKPHLNIVGDLYNRGAHSKDVIDFLIDYKDVSIQWGNHDIIWMGAFAGSEACVANVLRISLRYGNIKTLVSDYNISLSVLEKFAREYYGEDPCLEFFPKKKIDTHYKEEDSSIIAKMHKAISLIQFKLEGLIIERRPQFLMDERRCLDNIDFEKKSYYMDGKNYALRSCQFPTIDFQSPNSLTEPENLVISKLVAEFKTSKRLKFHVEFLINNGSMFRASKYYLAFHGCVPLTQIGDLKCAFFEFDCKGKQLFTQFEEVIRSYYSNSIDQEKREFAKDIMWYLWCGPDSPLFGKNRMTTFERYFISEKESQIEQKNPYFLFRDKEPIVKQLLLDFHVKSINARIINGHIPIKITQGESPIRANGKTILIDGGMSIDYQKLTGIKGLVLISYREKFYLYANKSDEKNHYFCEKIQIH